MLILNKRQIYSKQYGHGIGSFLKNIVNNDIVRKGFKSLGKMLYSFIQKPENMSNVTKVLQNVKFKNFLNKEKLKKIPGAVIEQTKSYLKGENDFGVLNDRSKETLNELLYGEGISQKSKNILKKLIHNK